MQLVESINYFIKFQSVVSVILLYVHFTISLHFTLSLRQFQEYFENNYLNPKWAQLFLGAIILILVIFIARFISEIIGASIYQRTTIAKNKLLTEISKIVLTDVKKFKELSWKLTYHSLTSLYVILFFIGEPFLFYQCEKLPSQDDNKNYWFVMIQTAFYIWMTICVRADVRKNVRLFCFQRLKNNLKISIKLLVRGIINKCFNVID